MITPEPPGFLKIYQPHLRNNLVDEGRYTDEKLGLVQTPLSGVFSVENAGESWATLQRAVDRIVAITQADPNKEHIDKVITRWIKRHLQRLGAEVNLEQLNSLVEDKDMLAENLENLVQKERRAGEQLGIEKGRQEAEKRALESKRNAALKLITRTEMDDQMIADIEELPVEEVERLRAETQH
ncbi:MAG: hypothetical protein M1154_02305 [Gammaproteobacteria bacterium]|nr:hypothetical protein [Gammaproteobacteria bacterium]